MQAQALTLPPIPLAQLRERTKDFILGVAAANGLTPDAVISRVLDRAADAQLTPAQSPTPQPEGDSRKAALAA